MDLSKFNLWRACIAFCKMDSTLALQEKNWMEEKQNTLNFTDEQLNILEKDLQNPPDLNDILLNIKSPADRAFLIDQMRVLARVDGTLSSEEKDKIEDMREQVLANVDLNEAEANIAAKELASYSEDEIYQVDNKHSFFERLHRYVQRPLSRPGFQSSSLFS